jgi:hypothetical protein
MQLWSIVFIRDSLLQVNRNCRGRDVDAVEHNDSRPVASTWRKDLHAHERQQARREDTAGIMPPLSIVNRRIQRSHYNWCFLEYCHSLSQYSAINFFVSLLSSIR